MATGWWPQPVGLALGPPPLSSSHLELNRTATRTRRKPQRPPGKPPACFWGWPSILCFTLTAASATCKPSAHCGVLQAALEPGERSRGTQAAPDGIQAASLTGCVLVRPPGASGSAFAPWVTKPPCREDEFRALTHRPSRYRGTINDSCHYWGPWSWWPKTLRAQKSSTRPWSLSFPSVSSPAHHWTLPPVDTALGPQ